MFRAVYTLRILSQIGDCSQVARIAAKLNCWAQHPRATGAQMTQGPSGATVRDLCKRIHQKVCGDAWKKAFTGSRAAGRTY